MIRIQNIYYMLAYAFQVLQERGYESCGTEEFENTADLLSAILVKGVSTQIKRGLQSYNTYWTAEQVKANKKVEGQSLHRVQLSCDTNKPKKELCPS